MTSQPKVWLITGCSAGFGISLARAVLAHGHHLIASSRNPSKTLELVQEVKQKGGHWLALDVTSPAKNIKRTIDEAVALHGRLDVVVNNAGFAVLGAVEDITEEMARAQFETNVIGALKVTQCALPAMRAARSGTVVNISSISGLVSRAGLSMYAASKHALEGISEALAQEVAPFGVRVIVVEPGLFRTNFLEHGAATYEQPSEPYRGTVVEDNIQYLQGRHGKQPGDPDKAAERIYEVVTGEGMAQGKPEHLRLVLGSNAFRTAQTKIEQLQRNLTELEELSMSTEYAS
ncbi:hypothetical protein ATERTT37_000869 [Aspergillus terreus]